MPVEAEHKKTFTATDIFFSFDWGTKNKSLFIPIRHGLCVSNGIKGPNDEWLSKPFFQPDDDPLTPEGEYQVDLRAEAIALDERFPKEQVIVAASKLRRQWDSAERFAKRLGFLDVVEFPELREKKPSSCYVGKTHDDEKAKVCRELIKQNRDNPNYHHSDEFHQGDEENEWEVVDRLRKGRERWLQLEAGITVYAWTSGTTMRFLHAVLLEPERAQHPVQRFRELDDNPKPIINGGYTVYKREAITFRYIPDMYDAELNLLIPPPSLATYGIVGT